MLKLSSEVIDHKNDQEDRRSEGGDLEDGFGCSERNPGGSEWGDREAEGGVKGEEDDILIKNSEESCG